MVRGRVRGRPDQDRWERADWWGVVVDSPEPRALARFYAELLGWPVWHPEEEGLTLDADEGVGYLAFQRDEGYVRPVWPPEPGAQRMMMHVDVKGSDLEAAVAHALELGAELPAHQPQDDVRVLLDPDGHPFCLYA